ncbi:MAG TPA: class I SAM-dependent methyltransferase [Candidatus Nanoarchaeia archaeon]|nr:class I SAM-dependent methyltransferase [Candidatus Nanoarchaeia archaeon]
MQKAIEITKCRACDSSNLVPIISLGNQCVTNFIASEDEKCVRAPLDLVLCNHCKLLQLKHNAPPESMWDEQYWYKSGISITIKNDLKNIVENIEKMIKLDKGDNIIDIGCNDGTLLSFYSKPVHHIGFDPSKNVAREATAKGFDVVNNFFNKENYKEKFGEKKAKVITAISMFYDLENPNQFLKDIVDILDKKGLFVIQQNYLLTMLKYNAFDNICHEHREYYSLLSLKNILEKHGLEIFDVELNDINGGSIRTYIRFKGETALKPKEGSEQRIKDLLEKEREMKLETLEPYQAFASRIKGIKDKLLSFIKEEKKKGKKIWIYGASTRGNVILQYFGLNDKLIDYAADKNTDKWGKKTIGSLIPITSPENFRESNPDYLLVMVWHFFDEIKKQEAEWFNAGGKFIIPLPEFKIVSL